MYIKKYKYENLEKTHCSFAGKYDIPILKGIESIGECPNFVGFNYAKSTKDKANKGIHFFIDDYQFSRLWHRPDNYINILKDYQCVMTPDFSLYTDFPKAMQIYNHYRKHWLGAYWESLGIKVIPTIGWSNSDSFEWCFDGEPKHSVVAVPSVGTQHSKQAKALFMEGYTQMLERLKPEKIIFYGNVPEECKDDIIRIRAFQEKFREARISGY